MVRARTPLMPYACAFLPHVCAVSPVRCCDGVEGHRGQPKPAKAENRALSSSSWQLRFCTSVFTCWSIDYRLHTPRATSLRIMLWVGRLLRRRRRCGLNEKVSGGAQESRRWVQQRWPSSGGVAQGRLRTFVATAIIIVHAAHIALPATASLVVTPSMDVARRGAATLVEGRHQRAPRLAGVFRVCRDALCDAEGPKRREAEIGRQTGWLTARLLRRRSWRSFTREKQHACVERSTGGRR